MAASVFSDTDMVDDVVVMLIAALHVERMKALKRGSSVIGEE